MMIAPLTRRTMAVASAAALLAALSGCSLLGGGDDPDEDTAANDAAAAKFVACLTNQGQTAKILEGGMVGLLLPDGPDDDGPGELSTSTGPDDGGPVGTIAIMKDGDGEWMAATSAEGFPEDNGMRDAWTACEAEVPEFEQPEPDLDGASVDSVSSEEQMEAALAFADCARDNGFADFPDPGENGSMNLPDGMTEDGFRQLLEDCFDPENPMGMMLDKETVDSLDFDLMSVMDDFFQAHPEYAGPMGGGATSEAQ